MKFWSSIKFWGALFSPKSNLWPTCVSGLTRNKTISLMSQSAAKWLTFFHLACSLFTHAFGMAWNPFTDSCRSIFPKRSSQNWIAGKNPTLHLVVSWNRATPSSHPFIDGIFHYRPTIVGYPHDYGKPHVGEKNILPLSPQPLDGVTIVISVPYSSESGLCGIPAAGFPVWEANWIDIHIHIQKMSMSMPVRMCRCIFLCLCLCVCVGVYVYVYACAYV